MDARTGGRSGSGIDMIRAAAPPKVDEKCRTNIDLRRPTRTMDRTRPVSQSSTDGQWYRKTDQPTRLPAHATSSKALSLLNGNRML